MHGRLFLTLLFSPWTIESAPSRENLASPLYRKRSGNCAIGDTDCGREAYPNGAGKRPPIENSPQTSRRLPVKLGGVRGAIPHRAGGFFKFVYRLNRVVHTLSALLKKAL